MARGDAFNSIDAFTHCNQSSRSRLEGAANVISVTRDDAPIVALSRNNFSKNGVGARFAPSGQRRRRPQLSRKVIKVLLIAIRARCATCSTAGSRARLRNISKPSRGPLASRDVL